MTKKILLLGAGRSATYLIDYLLNACSHFDWQLVVNDLSLDLALQKTKNHPKAQAVSFDIADEVKRKQAISNSDLVVSMLPANLHITIALDCLALAKHLFTASYLSREIKQLDIEARAKNLLFLNECGLDPGLDHMSAMKIIHDLKEKGAKIKSFKSYCGGLVAPQHDDNPWSYKFSWNPRNVILAGQGTAKYLYKSADKFIPYSRIFTDTDLIEIENFGQFEAYANRNSLSYQSIYHLEEAETLLRGTLRKPGFCSAWNVFVKLGLTDDTYLCELNNMDYASFVQSFLPRSINGDTVKSRLSNFLHEAENSHIMEQIAWTGILSKNKIPFAQASPAQVLQHLLEEKWKLQSHETDMVVMQHIFEYELNAKNTTLKSSLVAIGNDDKYTAMAKTVGLPLAIAVSLFLQEKFAAKGVVIPVQANIYEPILLELEKEGIAFVEA